MHLLASTMPSSLQHPRNCALKPPFETILNSVVGGLLGEGTAIPNGTIVDAGAKFGRWSCYYAATAPDRIVHAVDPDERNIKHMRARYTRRRLPNLRPLHGGLSNESSSSYSSRAAAGAPKIYTPSRDFPVYALDDLFGAGGAWAGDTLAFAHFDVEGLEELVLAGAARTIARDQPLLTTELTVHKHPERTRSLLALMERWGYDSLLVEEIAGNRVDIRNCIHLPRSRKKQLLNSNVLDLGVASRALLAVTADTVNRTSFPCCAVGGECCPRAADFECCSHGAVHAWMNRAVRDRGAPADCTHARPRDASAPCSRALAAGATRRRRSEPADEDTMVRRGVSGMEGGPHAALVPSALSDG